jgi:hypothetical protein
MISKGNARSGANLNDPCTSYEIAFPDSAKKYALMLIFRKYPIQSKLNHPIKYLRIQ